MSADESLSEQVARLAGKFAEHDEELNEVEDRLITGEMQIEDVVASIDLMRRNLRVLCRVLITLAVKLEQVESGSALWAE